MFNKISELLNRQNTLEKKLFWGLTIFLTISCFIAFFMTISEYLTYNLQPIALITAGICIIPPISIMLICRKTQAYGKCFMAMVIAMGAVFLPVTFFANGGMFSGMPLYCLGGVLLSGFCLERKYRLISFIVSLLSCAGCFIVSVLFPETVVDISNTAFIKSDIIASFIITSIAMFCFYTLVMDEYENTVIREKKEAERKAEMQLELMNIQLENVADLKRIRHDVRHNDALILEYAQNGDLEGLKRYMKQKMYTDEYYATKIYCMHAVINNILTIYTRRAQKENITVNISADVVNTLNISEPDLVSSLANMFENAIHGTREQTSGEKRIDVDVHSKGSRLIMKISNTVREGLRLVEGYPTSRPGTGINSITTAAENNDGTVTYKLEDGVLTCVVILTIPGK